MKHLAWVLSAYLALAIILLPAATNAQSSVDFEISKESFFEEGLAPVRKSGPYDVTIVYFMDYQCPACRKYTPDLARVLKEDSRIRVIYRDTPLLGPRSDKAALAAIASSFQGRHEAFHHALMMTKGPLDDSAIKAAAKKAGVDWSRLQRDMISRRENIDLLIARNFELATDIGIAGTPAFIVGERQSNGALDYQSLKLEIAEARKELRNRNVAPGEVETTAGKSDPKLERAREAAATASEAKETDKSSTSVGKREVKHRPPSPERSEGARAWKSLIGPVVGLLGLAGIWSWAFRRRKARSNSANSK